MWVAVIWLVSRFFLKFPSDVAWPRVAASEDASILLSPMGAHPAKINAKTEADSLMFKAAPQPHAYLKSFSPMRGRQNVSLLTSNTSDLELERGRSRRDIDAHGPFGRAALECPNLTLPRVTGNATKHQSHSQGSTTTSQATVNGT